MACYGHTVSDDLIRSRVITVNINTVGCLAVKA
jgi:hypothetical protein